MVVKRKDNHAKFMKKLEKATTEVLTEAAQLHMQISQQLVSRPYTGGKRRLSKSAIAKANAKKRETSANR